MTIHINQIDGRDLTDLINLRAGYCPECDVWCRIDIDPSAVDEACPVCGGRTVMGLVNVIDYNDAA